MIPGPIREAFLLNSDLEERGGGGGLETWSFWRSLVLLTAEIPPIFEAFGIVTGTRLSDLCMGRPSKKRRRLCLPPREVWLSGLGRGISRIV